MRQKKILKIDFVDFWPDFKKEDNYFYNLLKEDYNVEITDTPDYVFCSSFGHNHYKYKDAVKIFYTGENLVPDFNLYDYAMGFSYLEFEDRYIRLPLYVLYCNSVNRALKKHEHEDGYYLTKTGFCASVISNPDGAHERDEIINCINKYKQVSSGGRFHNNIGGPVSNKYEFIKKYKFVLALENSMQNGYTTEKIIEAFGADAIPVYWGSPDIKKEFNPDSFIYAGDYDSYDALVEQIKAIDSDDKLYLKMIKTPMLNDNCQASMYLNKEYTKRFFDNIFNQDLSQAYRRNMFYAGRKYAREFCCAFKIADVFMIFKKAAHAVWKKRMQRKSAK